MACLASSQKLGARSRLVLRRQRQPEHRNLSLSGDVHHCFGGIRQIERLAVLAAIDFGIAAPGFFRVAAGLFQHIGGVEPALQMAAARFAFFVFFVAGALPRLLDFDFMMRELRHGCRSCTANFAGRQSGILRCGHGRGIRAYRRNCIRKYTTGECSRTPASARSARRLPVRRRCPRGNNFRALPPKSPCAA